MRIVHHNTRHETDGAGRPPAPSVAHRGVVQTPRGPRIEGIQVAIHGAKGLAPLLSLVAALLIAGCAASPTLSPDVQVGPPGPSPTVTVPHRMPVTLTLAGRFPAEVLAALDQQIALFEAQNPEILVEIITSPAGTAAERRAWVASSLRGAEPSIDLYQVESAWLADLAPGGGLVPLDDAQATWGVAAEALVPGTLEANSFAARLVALPWTADAGLLYYRSDLLEEYGYPIPANWEELGQIALELAEKADLAQGFVWSGAADEDLTCVVLEFLWSFGADVVGEQGNVVVDSPASRAALEQMQRLVTSGASPRDIVAYDAWRSMTVFRDGQAAFMRNGAWAWNFLDREGSPVQGVVGVAPLPASCRGGQSLLLSEHSLHPDKALQFMAFLIGEQQQAQMAMLASQPPVLAGLYAHPEVTAAAPFVSGFGAALRNARLLPHGADHTFAAAIYQEAHRMLAGEQDARATSRAIQLRLDSWARP
jgi:multiple sugar transport system substrate-binding protein